MRFVFPAVVLACATLSSAEFLLAKDASDAIADQPNLIQWDVNDFSDSVDIFVADEDADENDENAGIKIADSTPNVGTFTWVPSKGEAGGKKKKKIWGKDKKGKKKKGKKLIGIIFMPGQTVTLPGQILTMPGAVITSIGTLTRTATLIVTTPAVGQPVVTTPGGGQSQPPMQTGKPPGGGSPPGQSQPPSQTTGVPGDRPPSQSQPGGGGQVPVPSASFQPPFGSPTGGGKQTASVPGGGGGGGGQTGSAPGGAPTTLVTQPPAGQITSAELSNTLFRPTPTGTGGGGVAPPLFTGAAMRIDGRGVFVGGFAGLVALGML